MQKPVVGKTMLHPRWSACGPAARRGATTGTRASVPVTSKQTGGRLCNMHLPNTGYAKTPTMSRPRWNLPEGLVMGGLGVLGFSFTLPATRAAVLSMGGITVGLAASVM